MHAKSREMPESAKTKKIKVPFDDDSFTVRIEEEPGRWARTVHVWMGEHPKGPFNRAMTEGIETGQYLGAVEQYEHSSSRHLFGNVAHYYEARMKWFPQDRTQVEHESMADAIRTLVNDARPRQW